MAGPIILTVSQLNRYIKSRFEEDKNLSNIYISGEISNFTNHYRSGHLYFSIKDESAAVKSVMFAGQASRLRFAPKDGMKVIARGRVSVYEATGQYQLYVEELQPDGVGALSLAFEQLKEKLFKEGLFDDSHKKPLPRFPEKIGVVTSSTGAAVRDICNVLARRYPVAEIILAPVLVQGDGAAPQIAEAIERFNKLDCADVLIVGRGGGSTEDLWAFNEEIVARAIYSSHIPVISAVGHEVDYTIADFVADLRAPTPSAAAELAVPDMNELAGIIEGLRYQLRNDVMSKLNDCRQRLDMLCRTPAFQSPMHLLESRRSRLDNLANELNRLYAKRINDEKMKLSALAYRLDALSPLKVLSDGYAAVTDKEGKWKESSADIHKGDTLFIKMKDGTVECTVDDIIPEGNNG